eukprot:6458311-Amphidinium_carterae.5
MPGAMNSLEMRSRMISRISCKHAPLLVGHVGGQLRMCPEALAIPSGSRANCFILNNATRAVVGVKNRAGWATSMSSVAGDAEALMNKQAPEVGLMWATCETARDR